MDMEYRRLGGSGLKVSVLSFGSWVTFGPQLAGNLAEDCLAAAYDAGVNFFDNAEAYSAGESERIMGEAIAALGWPRHSYVLSTKLFWGLHQSVNMRNTLNRKYLMQAIDGSLDRLGLDFVDLVYCHRPDPRDPHRGDGVGPLRHHLEREGPLLGDVGVVGRGHSVRRGTSPTGTTSTSRSWSSPSTTCSGGTGWRRSTPPSTTGIGLGLTTWSPLASGLLTGKYLDGVPDGSRATLPGYEWLAKMLTDPERNQKVRALESIAKELDCTLAQLSIAWCAKNPHVSSVITGASRVEQVHENLAALDVLPKLTDDVLARIDAATG